MDPNVLMSLRVLYILVFIILRVESRNTFSLAMLLAGVCLLNMCASTSIWCQSRTSSPVRISPLIISGFLWLLALCLWTGRLPAWLLYRDSWLSGAHPLETMWSAFRHLICDNAPGADFLLSGCLGQWEVARWRTPDVRRWDTNSDLRHHGNASAARVAHMLPASPHNWYKLQLTIP